jgi:hypothetical protein
MIVCSCVSPQTCARCRDALRDYDQFHRPLKEMFVRHDDGRFTVPIERLWWITQPGPAMRPEDV